MLPLLAATATPKVVVLAVAVCVGADPVPEPIEATFRTAPEPVEYLTMYPADCVVDVVAGREIPDGPAVPFDPLRTFTGVVAVVKYEPTIYTNAPVGSQATFWAVFVAVVLPRDVDEVSFNKLYHAGTPADEYLTRYGIIFIPIIAVGIVIVTALARISPVETAWNNLTACTVATCCIVPHAYKLPLGSMAKP
jgi:hypothetical protein